MAETNYGSAASATDATMQQGFSDVGSMVSSDYMARKYQGMISPGDYQQWKAEQMFNLASAREARLWEKQEADTAWQRKVADMEKAGFSPLAALEGSQGAAVASASAAESAHGKHNAPGGNPGGVFGAILGALVMLATKGMSAAASAKSAVALEGMRQANKVALEAIRQDRLDDRAVQYTLSQSGPSGRLTEYFRKNK